MNSKERFNEAAQGRTPDFVPAVYYGFGAGHGILESAGLTWQEIFWNGEKISRVMQKAHELLPHDNICSFLSPACGLDALGTEIIFSDLIGPHIDYKRTFLNSWEDLERLEVPDPMKDGSMSSRIEAAELLSARFGRELAVLGGCGGISTWAMALRGAGNFALDAKRDPEFQNGYMDFLTECAVEFCVAQAKAGCDWIISAEDAFAITVLDPERAWRINGTRAKRLARAVADTGAGYILHCCGDAKLSLQKMVDTGADVLSLDNVDLAHAKEKVGGEVALMGNIKLKTLLHDSPNAVEAECIQAIVKASRQGGFLLSSGYIYPPNTPLENISRLIDTARTRGRYDSS